jgi:hypothetical protein
MKNLQKIKNQKSKIKNQKSKSKSDLSNKLIYNGFSENSKMKCQ